MIIHHQNPGSGDNGPRAAHPEGAIYDPAGFQRVEAAHRTTNLFSAIFFVLFLAAWLLGLPLAFVADFIVILIVIAIRMRYDAILRAHATSTEIAATKHLLSTQKGGKVINNVTLNLSNGSSFTGPLAVGQNIKISYEVASSIEGSKLRESLENLIATVTKLVEAIGDHKLKEDTSTQLKAFVEEAKKQSPSKWMLGVSSKGLIDAASTVAQLANPVSTAVRAVLSLLG